MIVDKRECYFCGSQGVLQTHHCQHGSRRRKADLYDLTVYLCPECHKRLHDQGIGDRELQKLSQAYFEELYGHDMWMREFHKNYL